jgi:paraquat-inducible protein B
MSGTSPPGSTPPSPPPRPPAQPPSAGEAAPEGPYSHIHTRRPFHFVWLIPIVAAVVAGFLAWRAISERGPTITITFLTADGLVAGQTKIRHKAVDLGTVRRITLSEDMAHVTIEADMRREADRYLTETASFWVVRPRLTAGNISGLDTLLSGSYIELDPGAQRGAPKTEFVGLEEPPAVRSDVPGTSYLLKAERIGSLSSGSPVFYHDIAAGEVLGYDAHPTEPDQTIDVHVFVRAPYDKLVRSDTHFWNASGLNVELGAQGVQLRVESLQALLSGGIAFDTPKTDHDATLAAAGASFTLYNDQAAAATAGFRERIPFLVYFRGSVRGLAVGAPVELFGIQIGTVTAVSLEFDPTGQESRVAVRFEIHPELLLRQDQLRDSDPIDVSRRMVAHGMRVQLRSANLLTGQLLVAMDYFQDVPAEKVEVQDGVVVLPVVPGGLDSITADVGQILRKVDALPLGAIAQNLNEALAGVRGITAGPELRQSLRSLTDTLTSVDELVHKADAGAGPALKRLPEIAQGLQAVVDRAGKLVGSADTGYGADSEFRRDLQRLLEQVSDTARSVRLLADYLDQHPDALLRGRPGGTGTR